jgi:hypothetical protein
MGIEPDPDGWRGEGVAGRPGAANSLGLPVPLSLPRFRPQGTPGGQLDPVKDLCLKSNCCLEISLPKSIK